jgi:hypothetical protein
MLTAADKKEFVRGGFTNLEIQKIEHDLEERPQEIDPTNEAWQQVFRKRLDYIRSQLNLHKPLREIYAKLDSYLTVSGKRTPWDFMRELYPIKGGKKADFTARVDARAKGRIRTHFKGTY